ncbi:MAG: trypsin-like peptidase domain-containing protein [Pirellulales bacterium]
MDESNQLPAAYRTPDVPTAPSQADQPAAAKTTSRWFTVLVFLTMVAAAPYLVGQFIYQVRFNELKAGVDVATEALADLKPRLTDFELASRMVAKRVEPSVVSVFRPGFHGGEGQGSGVIVDPAGYVVTNFHVVNGARSISVHLTDGRVTPASIVGADDITDLAVLKIDLPNLIAADWGDSDELQVGDLVWALGSPFGLERSFTFGIVSAKGRRSGNAATRMNLYQEYLQTDAAVNPGNSGGPLINIEGKVIGINAAIFGPSYQGISFAIPSSVARVQYEVLKAKGWIERAYLGIRPVAVPQIIQKQLGLAIGEGVYVGHVEPEAPAERAGIHTGDVILKWNDSVATDPTLLSRAIAATKVGSTAKVRLARVEPSKSEANPQRSELELSVEVERHPDSMPTRDVGE